jgi:hypothetical protein
VQVKENVGEVWCFVVCKGYLSCSAAVEDRQLQENPYSRVGSEKKKIEAKDAAFPSGREPPAIKSQPVANTAAGPGAECLTSSVP